MSCTASAPQPTPRHISPPERAYLRVWLEEVLAAVKCEARTAFRRSSRLQRWLAVHGLTATQDQWDDVTSKILDLGEQFGVVDFGDEDTEGAVTAAAGEAPEQAQDAGGPNQHQAEPAP